MKMIIEQTKRYPNRMIYNPETRTFSDSKKISISSVRKFDYPYGWIKESGTPPEPHCDCILMADGEYELGDEVSVRLIGMFKRKDGDHKYIVVKVDRNINDFEELSGTEKEALKKLYPRVDAGEGWFGHAEAVYCYENCERAL